jgi:hypothetical protein
VVNPITGDTLDYRQLFKGPDGPIWLQGCANEIGRLAQGLKGTCVSGTDTIHFMKHTGDLPRDRTATYLRIVTSLRPQKAEPHQVRFTAGGNLIKYPRDVSMPTADMTTTKLVLNSTVSMPGAEFSYFDLANFYLNTPMLRYEYM